MPSSRPLAPQGCGAGTSTDNLQNTLTFGQAKAPRRLAGRVGEPESSVIWESASSGRELGRRACSGIDLLDWNARNLANDVGGLCGPTRVAGAKDIHRNALLRVVGNGKALQLATFVEGIVASASPPETSGVCGSLPCRTKNSLPRVILPPAAQP